MVVIGDSWDEQIIFEIPSLLKKYEDLFLQNFVEVKGIKADLGEMKIVLNLDIKLIKHHPYR